MINFERIKMEKEFRSVPVQLLFVSYILVLAISGIGCLRIQIATSDVAKPIVYSDLPNPAIKDFRIRKTLLFWTNYQISDPLNIEDIVNQQLKENPEAVGIKNFKVRIFDSVWNCGGGPLMAFPVTFVTCPATGAAAVLGFVFKRVEVSGDLYATQK